MKQFKLFLGDLIDATFAALACFLMVFFVYIHCGYGGDDLSSAAYNGEYMKMRVLLAAGVNPSHIGFEEHFTPLGKALLGERLEATRLLLAYGADPNVKDDHANTAVDANRFTFCSKPDTPLQIRIKALLRQHGAH